MNQSKNNEVRHQKATSQTTPAHQKNANLTSKNQNNNTKDSFFKQNNTNSNNQDENIQNASVDKKPSKLKYLPNSKDAKKHMIISALIFIAGTIIVGIIATLLGGKMRDGLTKPPAYPPDWVFTIAWSILYISIGIASFLAFKSVEENKKRRDDIIWYVIHLFFNFMWPLFYFRLNLAIFSCIWLVFTIATAIVVTYRYYRANLCSGIIFTIYTLWLIFALYLNLGIAMLNM